MSDKPEKMKGDAKEWDLDDRDRHLRPGGVLHADTQAVVHTTVLVEADD